MFQIMISDVDHFQLSTNCFSNSLTVWPVNSQMSPCAVAGRAGELPKREELEGFLRPDQGDRVTTHLRECIQYLTESYTSGGHARPFQAAKQHLMDILTAETAPQEPSAAEDAAIEEATDQDHADDAPENPAPGAD